MDYASGVLIAAALVGLLCAYHFGLRTGVIGAGVTLVLLFAALVVPGYALPIYAVVGLGVVGVCLIGPRVSRDEARPVKRSLRAAIQIGRRLYGQLVAQSRQRRR
jgi:hypothetical protein